MKVSQTFQLLLKATQMMSPDRPETEARPASVCRKWTSTAVGPRTARCPREESPRTFAADAHSALDSHREDAVIPTRRHNSSWHLLSAGWEVDLLLRTPHVSSLRDDSPVSSRQRPRWTGEQTEALREEAAAGSTASRGCNEVDFYSSAGPAVLEETVYVLQLSLGFSDLRCRAG